MRPLISGRTTTLWRERRLPTVSAASVRGIRRTRPTSTATTRPLPLLAATSCAGGADAGRCSHHAAPAAAAMPATATTR